MKVSRERFSTSLEQERFEQHLSSWFVSLDNPDLRRPGVHQLCDSLYYVRLQDEYDKKEQESMYCHEDQRPANSRSSPRKVVAVVSIVALLTAIVYIE